MTLLFFFSPYRVFVSDGITEYSVGMDWCRTDGGFNSGRFPSRAVPIILMREGSVKFLL